MKTGKNFLTLALSFVLSIGAGTAAFGASTGVTASGKEPYELFVSAGKAHHSGSYRYNGTMNTEMVTSVKEESKGQKEDISLETIGKNKYSSYTVSTGKANGAALISESLLQGGKLYTRTFQEEAEKPKWTAVDAENPLQGDIISQILNYANNDDTTGLTYSFGKSKAINGTEHPQVVIGMDASFIQKIMAPLTNELVENLLNTIGTDSSGDTEKAYAAVLAAGIYKNMTVDMKAGCFIDPKTSRFRSMTVNGSIQMNLPGIKVTMKLSGDFIFYDLTEPVSLPIIRNEDILR